MQNLLDPGGTNASDYVRKKYSSSNRPTYTRTKERVEHIGTVLSREVRLSLSNKGETIRSKQGQLIVCEAICPKTGAIPDWLPFEFWGSRITSRRKANNNHHSKELIWVRP